MSEDIYEVTHKRREPRLPIPEITKALESLDKQDGTLYRELQIIKTELRALEVGVKKLTEIKMLTEEEAKKKRELIEYLHKKLGVDKP